MTDLHFKPFKFNVHISTLLAGVVFLSCLILAVFTYHGSKKMAQEQADQVKDLSIREVNSKVSRLMTGPLAIINLTSRQVGAQSLAKASTLEDRMISVPFLAEALVSVDHVMSIYAGYNNGDFFMLRRKSGNNIPEEYASEGRWIVRSAMRNESGSRVMSVFYLDKDFRIIGQTSNRTTYDPRSRPWYKQALDVSEPIVTDPYWMASDQVPGVTFARRNLLPEQERLELLKQGYTRFNEVVIGADVYLDKLSEELVRINITPSTQITMFDSKGQLMAFKDQSRLVVDLEDKKGQRQANHADLGFPELSVVQENWSRVANSGEEDWSFTVDGEHWLGTLKQLSTEFGPPIYLSIIVPESELYAEVNSIRNNVVMISVFFIILMLPLALWISRLFARPLEHINDEANAIRRFDFTKSPSSGSMITEISELEESIELVKKTINRFIEINMAVASEENFEHLLSTLLKETLAAANAGSGALYLTNSDNDLVLHVINEHHTSRKVEASINKLPKILEYAVTSLQVSTDQIMASDLDTSDLNDLALDHQEMYALAIPLANRQKNLTGAILLISDKPYETGLVDFITALAALSAVSLETRELIQAQKALFEAFVKLIAGAIDAKSPYTGGHCARVPELTKMLAKAANDDNDEFSDFKIRDDEWEAIHVASWLHDCGKVTTPEYVVDKATKLETLYDRIHEVRMRFEVLKRDAEITYWQGIAEGGDAASLKKQLDEQIHQIDDDYAFIAECNEGGEFMAPERIERLKGIAEKTWVRTLSDRIGISHEELQRKAVQPEPDLPVTEPLLADKPEHEFTRSEKDKMPEDNPWGFKLDVPELLYNKGEVYNLSVSRGTLSQEERYKINEHIVQTIIMLSELPFPKHLKDVSEIAGGHHEKMDGTGYPKRLKKNDMSPVARMMAIADIFEALTAVDRPYKKGKTLSEAIKIMGFMCKDQHIDADLFKLFLQSGVYKVYAEKYLQENQIDEVNIENYFP
jgi:HD-GYP domain-containing protein (c-di-GMP phosphodiesterase class II)